jgi:GxxExxY protein
MSTKLIHEDKTRAIIGACFNVYNDKGCGFLEAVYQECLEIEFEVLGIPFTTQKELCLSYRGRRLRQTFKLDFLCFDQVVVELKAVSALVDEHRAQVLNYLNASRCPVALLINFGHYPRLEFERLVLTDRAHKPISSPVHSKIN